MGAEGKSEKWLFYFFITQLLQYTIPEFLVYRVTNFFRRRIPRSGHPSSYKVKSGHPVLYSSPAELSFLFLLFVRSHHDFLCFICRHHFHLIPGLKLKTFSEKRCPYLCRGSFLFLLS